MNNFICLVVAVGIGLTSGQIPDQCGREVPQGKLLGGQNIQRCTWPFTPLVSIRIFSNADLGLNIGNLTICGGAIINNEYILTTATCAVPFYGLEADAMRKAARIVIGDYDSEMVDVGNDGRSEDVIPVVDVKIHNNYNKMTTSNNIAILKLAYPIVYNNCKQPACFEEQRTFTQGNCEVPEVDDVCTMAATGIKELNAVTTSTIPQKAHLKLFNGDVSKAIVQQVASNFLPEGTIIGRTDSPTVQACLFDWGGIVVCRKNDRFYLRGLISTNNCIIGASGQNLTTPPIFVTEVAAFRVWIDTCITNMATCPTLPFF